MEGGQSRLRGAFAFPATARGHRREGGRAGAGEGDGCHSGIFLDAPGTPFDRPDFRTGRGPADRGLAGGAQRIDLAETLRRGLGSTGRDDPGERRSGHGDRRDARRVPISAAADGGLDQPATHSADALWPVVLSRRGAAEARRHDATGASGNQPYRTAPDAGESVLQALDAAGAELAGRASGTDAEARDAGARRRCGPGAADRGGERCQPDAGAGERTGTRDGAAPQPGGRPRPAGASAAYGERAAGRDRRRSRAGNGIGRRSN